MVMASCASDGQPKESRPDGDHDIVGVIELSSKGIIGLIVPNMESIEARCDDRFAPSVLLVRWTVALGLGPLVTGELFDDELVVGFVLDQRIDNVVAVSPSVGFEAIAFVAIGFSEADPIEPVSPPTFAVVM